MSESGNINPYQPPQDKPVSVADEDLYEMLSQLADRTGRPREAFLFVLEGLQFARTHVRHETAVSGHIDAVDLCWCLHDLAVYFYGEGAREVLRGWNLNETADFGELVYMLIDARVMRASAEDRIEQFDNVFVFDEQFKRTEIEIVSDAEQNPSGSG